MAAVRRGSKTAIVFVVESCEQVVVWVGTVVFVCMEHGGMTTTCFVGNPLVSTAACYVVECHPWYKRRGFYHGSYINIIVSLYTYRLRDAR